ncbi:hypothetical protein TNIN_74911 [Trichonephila inaurata madagascariensis]|uniref:Uncharacterized protein n=1 Tax=Trichonephila inaurata madagascariensis TaxID=2747483 RepID=A0A8X6WQL6_9ARAC|nr:hypothetical protein TNIN_74911 [Trichonephila inaurata madagascariensis]
MRTIRAQKKLTAEVLTDLERRPTLREETRRKLEKAGKFKTNNKKPSKKQKKKRRQFVILKRRNYDDLCAVYKGYFYAKKKGPMFDRIQSIKCNKWLHEDCNDNHSH